MRIGARFFYAVAVAVAIAVTGAVAGAQGISYGTVTSVSSDGSLYVDAGSEAGFEAGDVLVIQRGGIRVGLAHVEQSGSGSSTAVVMRLNPGMSPQIGDIAAYQMLSSATSYSAPAARQSVSAPSFAQFAPAAQEPVPNIMKQEWLAAPAAVTDYDDEINRRLAELKKSPSNRASMIRLADAYFKKGWHNHAIEWNRRAIEHSPKAEDNDKLIFQIYRSYGYLNQPDNQFKYMEMLTKAYPNSVFISMKDKSAAKMPQIRIGADAVAPLEDSLGFRRGGMRVMSQSGTATTRIEGRLLGGEPALMSPNIFEPSVR